MMKKHVMKVKESYFGLLKNGKKTIELRLFDEKRREIEIGDEIEFHLFDNEMESFNSKVIGLYKAKSFRELCGDIDYKKAGFESKKELVEVLKEFYSDEKQEKYGVLGVEIDFI